MSTGANTDERKVALMLMAMEDLHAEAKGILAQMQAAASEASAASRDVKQASAAVVEFPRNSGPQPRPIMRPL